MTVEKNLEYYERSNPNLRDVTLCYLIDRKNNTILLAMKKRGFGAGKLNGVGGKCKNGESVEQAMIRETKEEINVDLIDYKKAGEISFYFDGEGNEGMNQKVHVFIAYGWNGIPTESEEMKPEWHRIDALDFSKMWDDDKYWLPLVVEGRYIKASFLFGDGNRVKELSVYARSSGF